MFLASIVFLRSVFVVDVITAVTVNWLTGIMFPRRLQILVLNVTNAAIG